MLPTIDYSVTVPVPVDVAFHSFQNYDRLLNRGIYEEIVWTEGVPWAVGSRLRYVVTQPVRATILAVVVGISSPRSIDLINHGLGVTAEQHISFGPDLRGGTRIRMILNLIGKSTLLSDDELHKGTTLIIHDALDTLVAACQRHPSGK